MGIMSELAQHILELEIELAEAQHELNKALSRKQRLRAHLDLIKYNQKKEE